jgi:diacylglycerol kinase (ATP)
MQPHPAPELSSRPHPHAVDVRATSGEEMRAIIIHNPSAGKGEIDARALRAEFDAAGYRVRYASTKSDDWKAALREKGDLVVAVGGDGTVAKTARRLVSASTPLAIIPTGTANNIASALDLTGNWRDFVHLLPGLEARAVDVGVATTSWGDRIFLEGVSFGPLAEAMREAGTASADDSAAEPGAELRRDLERLLRAVRGARPARYRTRAAAGGREGQALLVAVMNIATVGPNLRLAPEASMESGHLHLVVAPEEDRPGLVRYLEARLDGAEVNLTLDSHTVQRADVEWGVPLLHVDDDVITGKGDIVRAEFACKPGALRVLLPPRQPGPDRD